MVFLLKWKIWRIESALKSLAASRGIKPTIWSFGAYYIDPKHLVFVVGVQTDKEKTELNSSLEFKHAMSQLLIKYKWPSKARDHVKFDIESQETVTRESDGHWWYHYK